MEIRIEEIVPDDFEIVCRWLSDPTINRWLATEWRGRTVTPTVIAATLRGGRSRLFVVRADRRRVGLVALSDIDISDGLAMSWYLLGDRPKEGAGITSVAVGALMRIAFQQLGLRCVYAWIASTNVASRKVLERNGFKEAGRLRSATIIDGRVDDRVYFDLVATDFFE